jgi:tungstate transport system ATP-binding protein
MRDNLDSAAHLEHFPATRKPVRREKMRPTTESRAHSLSKGSQNALARLDDVSVRAGATTILDRISLTLQAGAPTALIGPNGSGKTTLLRVLMGLSDVASGTIAISGDERAFVFQTPVMLRRSVADNVAFALQAAGGEMSQIEPLLAQVGLVALRDRPARKLSGGEQQRLAIARALARKPALLLLDEATASLDPAQTKIIEDLIGKVAAMGVKIVFSTHDLGQARRLAGDVVLLVNGRVAEHAPAETFFSNPSSDAARRFLAGDLVL